MDHPADDTEHTSTSADEVAESQRLAVKDGAEKYRAEEFTGEKSSLREECFRACGGGCDCPADSCRLADCHLGDEGVVLDVESGDSVLRNKLLSMGVIRDTALRVTQVAPLGDPISILVRGFTLSLRRSEARCISFLRTARNRRPN